MGAFLLKIKNLKKSLILEFSCVIIHFVAYECAVSSAG